MAISSSDYRKMQLEAAERESYARATGADPIQEKQKMNLMAAQRQSRVRAGVAKSSRSGSKISVVEGTLMLGFGALCDIIDWFVIGSIPLLGDVLDFFAGFVIYFWQKTRGLDQRKPWFLSWTPGIATGIELIPGGDVLPSYFIGILFIIIMNTALGQRAWRIVTPI